MRHLIALIVVVFSLFSLVSCASRGFDRGAIKQDLSPDERVVTSKDIDEALSLKPQLTFPFKLGLYFKPYRKYSKNSHRARNSRIFLGDDINKVLSSLEGLKNDDILSDIFVIPHSIVSGHSTEAVRLAGAKMGADAVLYINGIYDEDSYQNPSAFLYLTLVGIWFIPGTKSETLFMTSAAMYDVGNGYIYLTTESDAEGSRTSPLAYHNSRENKALKVAREASLEGFSAELIKRLRALKGLQ